MLVGFLLRYLLEGHYPCPFLLFLPGIILSAFVFDRGSGFFATILSAALALYFFMEPQNSFVLPNADTLLTLAVFTGVGFLTAGIIEALRLSVEELAKAIGSLPSAGGRWRRISASSRR